MIRHDTGHSLMPRVVVQGVGIIHGHADSAQEYPEARERPNVRTIYSQRTHLEE